MGLIELIVTIAIIGILLWVVENYIPMDSGIKKLLQIIVLLVVVVWLLQSFGIIGHIGSGSVNDVRIR